ncbi:MAG: 3-methyl-2-oxobutanoate hydroxymethyltransferase [Candidatus Symbiobacter sp.]|nr:3-methyl-2-oxobutanoate hydroxymethyltransferase [Candidatus Symbiobacter sp.]
MPYGRRPRLEIPSDRDAPSQGQMPGRPSSLDNSPPEVMRTTVPDLLKHKGVRKIVVLTAYTAPVARAIDPFVDIALVGDSLGMVLYGYESTLPVSVNTMIRHGQAVVTATRKALVVVDLPFGSYQASPEQAFRTAAKIMIETGCQAVKLEGGKIMAATVQYLVERGIPVMGHIGLLPQSLHVVGGFRARGVGVGEVGDQERATIRRDAEALAEAGAFALVIEATSGKLAAEITQNIPILTIGIGASDQCDGQVLVTEDMAGLTPAPSPRFVKRFAELGELLAQAAADYAAEVRSGEFPSPKQFYRGKGDY